MDGNVLSYHVDVDNQMPLVLDGFKPSCQAFHWAIDDTHRLSYLQLLVVHHLEFFAMIEIVEIATNETVCEVEIDEEEGLCDYSANDRISKCFGFIGKELAKKK